MQERSRPHNLRPQVGRKTRTQTHFKSFVDKLLPCPFCSPVRLVGICGYQLQVDTFVLCLDLVSARALGVNHHTLIILSDLIDTKPILPPHLPLKVIDGIEDLSIALLRQREWEELPTVFVSDHEQPVYAVEACRVVEKVLRDTLERAR